jgi:transposase
MPRKQRTGRRRHHYSRDLKKRVIYQSRVLGKRSTAIAILLDMPVRVVQRVLQLYRDTGDVTKERTQAGRPPLMSEAASEVCVGAACILFADFTDFLLVYAGAS